MKSVAVGVCNIAIIFKWLLLDWISARERSINHHHTLVVIAVNSLRIYFSSFVETAVNDRFFGQLIRL